MNDYKKIEKTHFLSAYEVKVPNWTGTAVIRSPFSAWSTGGSLPWYEAYNTTKYDRHSAFEEATFQHLIDACCGLLVILSAQFQDNDFSSGHSFKVDVDTRDDMEVGIGESFRVRSPANWPTIATTSRCVVIPP